MTAITHRGRRAKADAVRQKALAAIERELWPNAVNRIAADLAPAIVAAIEAAGFRIVERKSP